MDKRARAPRPLELAEPLKRFREFAYDNPEIYVFFMDMFEQLSHKPTSTGYPRVKSFDDMLQLIDKVIKTVPEYNRTGLVGFPINGILNWAMGTPAGFAAFLEKRVNEQFKTILDSWAEYLESAASRDGLKTGKWLDEDALKVMSDKDDTGKVVVEFKDLFTCDPTKPYYGFTSWNNFFTRDFQDPAEHRPIDAGDDVVVSACEASPYRLSRNVELYRNFSVKGQPYSLAHLLDTAHKGNGEPGASDFVGGTVYQGFLQALNYHQWHSPVKGKIVACRKIPGSYYSAAPSALCDPAAPDISQGYIAHVATRVLIYIKAENEKIGTLCFVAIGMAEVSSCVINEEIKPNAPVEKGQKLGEFRYGGSSHCLVFNPEVKLKFIDNVEKIDRDAPTTVRVNAKLATVQAGSN
ncbi:phosphatidylserine decarboxylase [Saccharothrix ecbatanensis]|uniref:Phosphatidylserine decarboxylase n=1 Tax=Saccharothrix ecbatanensis TaxID=1105145 RepID=A0A7W9HJF6_9PSEU|nr:phosphatidylserine decarboxylase [Saccharothrix ecbatanensis]